MKELLYMYVESITGRADIQQQEIRFTNNYDIHLVREQAEDNMINDEDEFFNTNYTHKGTIKQIDLKEKENVFREIYGKNIISVSALVGVNGVGKSTILDMLGSTYNQRRVYMNNWKYFILYKYDDMYVIEGNVKDIIDGFVEDVSSMIGRYNYSFFCRYNKKSKKFKFEEFCEHCGEKEESIKVFYYRDRPIDKMGFLYDTYEREEDDQVCFERIDMTYDMANIYKAVCEFRNNEVFNRTVNLHNISIKVMPNISYKIETIELDDEEAKNLWVFEMLMAIAEKKYGVGEIVECIGVSPKKTIKYEHNKIDFYQKKLIELLTNGRKQTGELALQVQEIPRKFFAQKKERKYEFVSTIELTSVKEYCEEVFRLLHNYREYIHTSFYGVSAGEMKTLDVFAGIYYCAMNKGKDIEKEDGVNTEETVNIILLDEPDKGFHPEMSREFIYWLTNIFGKMDNGRSKFQFIISTHSPFLISDIPAPYVNCLKLDTKSETPKTLVELSPFGLLNSIPDLMKDTFFLESPFGEFGNIYYQKLLDKISKIKRSTGRDELELLVKKIDAVNDPVLHTFLRREYEKKELELYNTKSDMIKYYERKIKELKGEE